MEVPPLHKTISSILHHNDEPGLASAPVSSGIPRGIAQNRPRHAPSSRDEDDVRIALRWSNLR